jgi:choline dehydrogenase-like flavoprotein
MADLGELDVLIIGGGMGGCIVATDQSAPEFGREHKEFMRDVYILQRPHRVRAEYLKRGSIGISLVRPSGVLGKMDAYLDLEYDRTDPGTLRRLREGHEIGLEILKKMGARAISESEDGVRITNVSGISSSCRAGSDRSNSVVNSDFESHDVDNLLICDQSVQPRIASRGFGSPVAMFATYAAQRMVANYFS